MSAYTPRPSSKTEAAAGIIEACDLPAGPGYGLCSAAPTTSAAASAAPAPAAASQAPAKRRGRPA